MEIYGRKLKEYRKSMKLTQEQLATRLNMPQSNYSRLEKGELDIKLSMLLHICKTLGLSADWLIGLNEE